MILENANETGTLLLKFELALGFYFFVKMTFCMLMQSVYDKNVITIIDNQKEEFTFCKKDINSYIYHKDKQQFEIIFKNGERIILKMDFIDYEMIKEDMNIKKQTIEISKKEQI